MADPRDTARQWLAEVLYDTNRVFSDDVEDIADAISRRWRAMADAILVEACWRNDGQADLVLHCESCKEWFATWDASVSPYASVPLAQVIEKVEEHQRERHA